ncbi:MAG: TolC family protein [bacterium]
MSWRPLLARACAVCASTALLFAQQQAIAVPAGGPVLPRFRGNNVPPVRFAESARLAPLIRAGNLYLPLREAIALALENNLDVELQRLSPISAEAELLAARAGGAVPSLAPTIRGGPSGVGPARTLDVISLGGTEGAISPQINTGASQGNLQVGAASIAGGPARPLFDPIVTAAAGWEHFSQPQASPVLSGTTTLKTTDWFGDAGITTGFVTGTSVSASFNTTRTNVNSLRTLINPSFSSGLNFTFRQPLLEGFGIAVNNRFIRIANNNIRSAGLSFEIQLFATVFTVIQLYWDLVSLLEERNVRTQTLAASELQLKNTEAQERLGAVAPLEVYRARAEVAANRRDLAVNETRIRQQEIILKDYLISRTLGNSVLANVHVIPTDTVPVPPAILPATPMRDMVDTALSLRPDVAQGVIQLTNARIGLTGARSALLPTLDLVGSVGSNALVGTAVPFAPGDVPVNPTLVGGFGSGLSQLFGFNFPNYTVQLQLAIPVFNRAARSDYINAQVSVRQQEVRLQQIRKQVEVDLATSLVAVEQAAEAYRASTEQVAFEERTVAAVEKRYELGVATLYDVITARRDLESARLTAVIAATDYAKAEAGLERSLGTLLQAWGISVVNAYAGTPTVGPRKP